jgi:hypothetical protein
MPAGERHAYYERITHPELDYLETGASSNTFWDDVSLLTARGRLGDAWALLQLHSELRAVVEYTSSADDRRSLHTLSQLFIGHPVRFLEGLFSSGKQHDDREAGRMVQEYTAEWMKWRAQVDRVLGDPRACPLVSRLPQLVPLLEAMAGRAAAINLLGARHGAVMAAEGTDQSGGGSRPACCWRTLALCELIYGGPPVSSAALADVLQRSMALHRETAA